MTKTYDDILSTEDLENLDSFLKAWENVIGIVTSIGELLPNVTIPSDTLQQIPARRKECADLRRKLAVAIHYSEGGDRP